jgi:hypothetical protein
LRLHADSRWRIVPQRSRRGWSGDVEPPSMRLDSVRFDLTTLQVPPTWTKSDGDRPWLAKVLAPAVDTSVVLAALGLLAMLSVWVRVIAINVRDSAYLSLAFNVLVLGTVIARYAWRVWTVWRLTS